MGKFIKDNIHWIVIIVGVVAVLAYMKATQEETDDTKNSDKDGEKK